MPKIPLFRRPILNYYSELRREILRPNGDLFGEFHISGSYCGPPLSYFEAQNLDNLSDSSALDQDLEEIFDQPMSFTSPGDFTVQFDPMKKFIDRLPHTIVYDDGCLADLGDFSLEEEKNPMSPQNFARPGFDQPRPSATVSERTKEDPDPLDCPLMAGCAKGLDMARAKNP